MRLRVTICLFHLQYCPRYINIVDKFFPSSVCRSLHSDSHYLKLLLYFDAFRSLPLGYVARNTRLAPFLLSVCGHRPQTRSLLKDAPKPLRVFFSPAYHQPAVIGGFFWVGTCRRHLTALQFLPEASPSIFRHADRQGQTYEKSFPSLQGILQFLGKGSPNRPLDRPPIGAETAQRSGESLNQLSSAQTARVLLTSTSQRSLHPTGKETRMGSVLDSFDVIGIVIAVSALLRLTIA